MVKEMFNSRILSELIEVELMQLIIYYARITGYYGKVINMWHSNAMKNPVYHQSFTSAIK